MTTRRVLTWADVHFVAFLAAFIALPDSPGIRGYAVRVGISIVIATFVVLFSAGWFKARDRILARWDRRRAHQRAIDEATP